MKIGKPLWLILAIGVLIMFTTHACQARSGGSSQQQQSENRSEYRRISAEEAKKIMTTLPNVIILDVRTKEEFRERRIEGATWLHVDEIKKKALTVLPDKNALILVYCRRGIRSEIAARSLISMGYTNVFDFGGLDMWNYATVEGL